MLYRTILLRAVAGLAMAAALTVGAAQGSADDVRVLSWQGYGTDEAWSLELFTEKTGI